MCGSPVFKDLCIAHTLRRGQILADFEERIKSEFKFLQHQRGVGPAADQGHSSALYFLWWTKPVCDAGQRGRAVECEPADGVGKSA